MLVYFLPAILLLGIVTSYEDIKYGKIRNIWIISALAYSFAAHAVMLFFNQADFDYISRLLINGLLSLMAGVGLWLANFWTAGDAKLLFSYSMVLPLAFYGTASLDFFPSLKLLYYSIVPFAAFLVLSLFFARKPKAKIRLFSTDSIKSALFAFSFSWAYSIIAGSLGLSQNSFSLFAFLAVVSVILARIGVDAFWPSVLISILRLAFDASIYSWKAASELLFIVAAFVLLRSLLLSLASANFSREVKVGSLMEGMSPSENVVKTGKGFRKSSIFSSMLAGNPIIRSGASGITKQEIESLKKAAKNSNIKTLRINNTVSFSPFLFAAVLLLIFKLYFA